MEAEMRTQLRRQAAAHTDHVQDVLKVQEQELKADAEQVSRHSIQFYKTLTTNKLHQFFIFIFFCKHMSCSCFILTEFCSINRQVGWQKKQSGVNSYVSHEGHMSRGVAGCCSCLWRDCSGCWRNTLCLPLILLLSKGRWLLNLFTKFAQF